MATHYDDEYDDGYDDYEEDEYGEEGEEELSPEDQVLMSTGSLEVRKALGKDVVKVTNQQIKDALWHYYYDVDKSVAYLRKTYITPSAPKPTPSAKKTPEGRSHIIPLPAAHNLLSGHGLDHRSFSGAGYEESGLDGHQPNTGVFPILTKPQLSAKSYFNDMPWLNTPQDRHSVFVSPWRPRGGLLGGGEGAPMTKLQKLAAARKKKLNEAKEQQKMSQTEQDIEKLSISDKLQHDSVKPVPEAKRQKLSPNTENGLEKSSNAVPDQVSSATELEKEHDIITTTASLPGTTSLDYDYMAAPSSFAGVLCGLASSGPQRPKQEVFSMPYKSSPFYNAAAFDKPSPDDIVLTAQEKAGKKAPPTSTKAATKKEKSGESAKDTDVARAVSTLKISDAPPPKSKGLDVVRLFEEKSDKKSVSFVVVGHVDAGKSTLMGRLLLELKEVEQRTVDKYKRQAEKAGKQSFALAWVMDQRSEERDRGVTIDIATNNFETEKTKFTILDAPGHKDFVPNMIAGASQADFAILVIDANIGAYEKGLKGQTKEHVLLLRSIGVQRLVVAVNKLDMVDYSKERYEEIRDEVTGFLNGLGFQDKHVKFIPISGLNGDNIVRPLEAKAAPWYTGTTLIDVLEESGPSAARALTKPLRLAISEVFRSHQGTTTLAGRIDSGTMQIGDVLVVQPSGETAYIKSIVVDKENQDWAGAGQNVSIGLTHIDPVHVRVGDIICQPTDAIPVGDTFTMKAMAFEHLLPSPVDVHRGRLHAPGQIQSILSILDKATGEVVKKKPKVVQPGGVARIVIKLESKVPLEAGQRVVIRSGGETIAAGLLE